MIKAYRRTSFRYDFIRENHEKEINFSFKFVSQEGKDKKKPHFKGLNLHFEFFNIKKYKMNIASNELRNSKRKINDIALSLGYSNASKFSIAFQSVYGILPKDYRKAEN